MKNASYLMQKQPCMKLCVKVTYLVVRIIVDKIINIKEKDVIKYNMCRQLMTI